jgi:hypothetical protein
MTRRRIIAVLCASCAIGLSLGASPVSAAYYANHYGPIYSGYDQPWWASFWVQDGSLQFGWSDGTAYSGIWFVNGSQVRVSAAAYCNTAGCTAGQSWSGPYPDGYPIVHNHGNASPSYFTGTVY